MTSNQEKQIDINRDDIKDLNKKIDDQEDKVFNAIEKLGDHVTSKFEEMHKSISSLETQVIKTREKQYKEFRDFCSSRRKEIITTTNEDVAKNKNSISTLILKTIGGLLVASISVIGVGYNYVESKVSKETFEKDKEIYKIDQKNVKHRLSKLNEDVTDIKDNQNKIMDKLKIE